MIDAKTLARTNDPATSKAEATKAAKSGVTHERRVRLYACIKKHGMLGPLDLVEQTQIEYAEIYRRMADLCSLGFAKRVNIPGEKHCKWVPS
jgi:hypothetical protein